MHIYDKETHFQGGWALVAEQLPYAVGAARSIMMDKMLGYPGKTAFKNKVCSTYSLIVEGDCFRLFQDAE